MLNGPHAPRTCWLAQWAGSSRQQCTRAKLRKKSPKPGRTRVSIVCVVRRRRGVGAAPQGSPTLGHGGSVAAKVRWERGSQVSTKILGRRTRLFHLSFSLTASRVVLPKIPVLYKYTAAVGASQDRKKQNTKTRDRSQTTKENCPRKLPRPWPMKNMPSFVSSTCCSRARSAGVQRGSVSAQAPCHSRRPYLGPREYG